MDSYSSLGLKDFVLKFFVICCILCGVVSNRLGHSQSQKTNNKKQQKNNRATTEATTFDSHQVSRAKVAK